MKVRNKGMSLIWQRWLIAFLAGFAVCGTSFAHECEMRPTRPGKTDTETKTLVALAPLLVCSMPERASACNRFVGHALWTLFQNKDFMTGKDAFMLANDIANGLSLPGNAGWSLIGSANDQAALVRAQNYANQGKPVLAAKSASGNGHVALVIPGTLEKFNPANHLWGDLATPNSASFFLNNESKGFAGCPLSQVWKRPDGVKLYFKP